MAENETARENAIVIVHSITPDACYLPNSSIAGFAIVSSGIHAAKTCSNVNATTNPVMNMTSIFSTCSNDQAGVAGVISGTVIGKCEPIENQCKVRAEGQHILRDGDIVWMNNHNCLGIVKIIFPKKTAIISSPKGIAEDRALDNFSDLYPDADVIDPRNGATPDLSKYENVIIQGHGGQLMGSSISPGELAGFLNDSGFQGNSVELAGCNTATSFSGRKPYAERLSELLGIPVTGYPHEIMIKPGGIIRRINLTGVNFIDAELTSLTGLAGGAKPTPVTFP